jgi:hypothetical protein
MHKQCCTSGGDFSSEGKNRVSLVLREREALRLPLPVVCLVWLVFSSSAFRVVGFLFPRF